MPLTSRAFSARRLQSRAVSYRHGTVRFRVKAVRACHDTCARPSAGGTIRPLPRVTFSACVRRPLLLRDHVRRRTYIDRGYPQDRGHIRDAIIVPDEDTDKESAAAVVASVICANVRCCTVTLSSVYLLGGFTFTTGGAFRIVAYNYLYLNSPFVTQLQGVFIYVEPYYTLFPSIEPPIPVNPTRVATRN